MDHFVSLFQKAIEAFTGALSVIDNDHRYIHEGKAFSVRGNTGALTAGSGVYYITFRTPIATSGKYMHLRPVLISSTANLLLLEIHEGSVVGSLGSAVIPSNLNRNSDNPAKSLVYAGSGTVTDGTQIAQWCVGSGGGAGSNAGGGSGAAMERVARPDTVYTVKISAIGSVTATTGYFDLFFYEEDKG